MVAEKLPLLALAAASCAVTIWAQSEALEGLHVHSLGYRAANALVAFGQYLAGTFWPANLAPFYPLPPNGWPDALVAVCGAALVVLSAAAIWASRRFPYLFSGRFWYVGMLVPVVGLVQVAAQARADRYTYLPQIGLALALVWAADAAWEAFRLGLRWAWAISAALVLTLAVCGARQVSFWHDGEALWRHTIDSTVNNARAHANLAGILGRRRAFTEAIEHFEIAIGLEPDQAGPLNNYGITLREYGAAIGEYGQFKKAIECGQRAVALKPDEAINHENLGISLTQAGLNLKTPGLLDAAIAEYQEVLRLQPEDNKSRSSLARLYTERGRHEDAAREYAAVEAADPDFPSIHFYVANALTDSKSYEAAAKEYEEDLNRRPDAAETWHNLGVSLDRCGKPEEAVAKLVEALRRQPDNANFRRNLALTLREVAGRRRKEGKTAEATERLQQAVAVAPYDATCQRELGADLVRSGRSGEAIAHFRAVLSASPADAEAQLGLGAALVAEGKTDEAFEVFHKLIAAQPKNTAALNQMAMALLKKGKTGDALAQYRAALKISPKDAEAQQGMAAALLAENKTDEAIEVLRKLIVAQPDNAEALNQLAIALLKAKKTAEAIDVWEKLVRVAPKDIGAAQTGFLLARHGAGQRRRNPVPRRTEIESQRREAHERPGLDPGNFAGRVAAEWERSPGTSHPGRETERRQATRAVGHAVGGLRGDGPLPGSGADGRKGPATGHGGERRPLGRVAPQADQALRRGQAVARLAAGGRETLTYP